MHKRERRLGLPRPLSGFCWVGVLLDELSVHAIRMSPRLHWHQEIGSPRARCFWPGSSLGWVDEPGGMHFSVSMHETGVNIEKCSQD